MAENTYQATLDGGDSTETVELELIQGEPQRTITRSVEIDGETVEELWELDLSSPEYTYRREGYEGRDYS
ncbi:hypothetical protein [Naasia aerilata]|uniref:Uncharacterized protein n=1 Tax=Naasia aerilata TaxID=1162966 RepID=A0ABM8GGX9_9MICO|nr:hypothetical protein [Naasia aerilata]BDZ47626.1 hypothetical protein GCM10025866_35350 [Naasia aerilata]